jgi:hypothetical protein
VRASGVLKIDNSEIIDTVHARRPPVIPATAGLRTMR